MSVIEKDGSFLFIWRIEDFHLCLLQKGQKIESPVFLIEQLQNTEWYLTLSLPGEDEKNIELNLNRCKLDKGPCKLSIGGKLFIAKNNGSYIVLEKDTGDFEVNDLYIEALTITPQCILDNVIDFLFKDTLTVGYQFFISAEEVSLLPPIKCYARSHLSSKKYSILLPFKFYKLSNNYKYSFTSPIASTSTDYPEFHIDLHCYDFDEKEFPPISITIHMNQSYFKGFLLCKLTFLDTETTRYSCTTSYIFQPKTNGYLWRIDISKEIFNKHFISSATCLKCELVASTGKITSSLERTTYIQKMSNLSNSNCLDLSFLQDKLMKMYDKKILCDFKLIVSCREFPVHKTVLAAVSPVFQDMFESGMTETEKSQVTIEEFSVDAVEKMVEFSYSGTVKDLEWNVTLELYSIADKYQIQTLKTICSSFLKSSLSVETVPDLSLFVDLHQDTYLCKVVEDFIFGNSEAVFESDAWKHFMESNLQVASDVMYRIFKLYSKNNALL